MRIPTSRTRTRTAHRSGSPYHRSLAGAAAALMTPLLLWGGCAGPGASKSGGSPAADAGAEPVTLTYRQFSASPSLGNGEGSPDPRSGSYGALSVFVEKVASRTAALPGDASVRLSLAAGGTSLQDVANNVYSAAYFAGGSLNPVWGFAYNSVPFGPDFSRMVGFFYEGGGIELANRILAERGVDVVAFPVVGSPAQMSGYFKKPVGTPACAPTGDAECAAWGGGIGLQGMCAEPWTLRYLPPAEVIVNEACDAFAQPKRLRFVQAIPGGSAFLTAVQRGAINGLEFATPLDDLDAARGGFFANADSPAGSDGRNLGEVGLRFAHFPAWHQPFYIGWMVINRSQVWDELSAAQRDAIAAASRQALTESFNASSSAQCEPFRQILAINDGRPQRGAAGEAAGPSADIVLTEWSDADLARLRQATGRFLEAARGGASPSADQTDYGRVITRLYEYLGHQSIEEMLLAWRAPDLPVEGGCAF